MSGIEQEVLFERRGGLGHIVLNRPRAINALTHAMVTAITERLLEWRDDDSVRTVLVTGSGERGLCAGGDIVGLYHAAREGDVGAAGAFWADEYRMNALIAAYPKPYVAVMDGIVLGGGIGISAHGSHRIVTERSSLGLPEVGIGFVPDVGSTWLLARAPGELGTHVALTGGSVGAADAIELGLADVQIDSGRIAELVHALEDEHPDAVLARFAVAPGPSALAAGAAWISASYASDAVGDVLSALEGDGSAGALAAASEIRKKSPTALAVTLASLRRARELPDLGSVLQQEYRVSVHCLLSWDFTEGVRAQVIDKDRKPQWAQLPADVPALIAGYFAPLSDEPDLSTFAHSGGTR